MEIDRDYDFRPWNNEEKNSYNERQTRATQDQDRSDRLKNYTTLDRLIPNDKNLPSAYMLRRTDLANPVKRHATKKLDDNFLVEVGKHPDIKQYSKIGKTTVYYYKPTESVVDLLDLQNAVNEY